MLTCPSGHPNKEDNKFCVQCGARLETLLKTGSIFRERFKVERMLSSSGGFGLTYLVRDLDMFGQLRVLKQLRAARQDGKALELFEREARALSLLSHPQIPKLHAFFSDPNAHYLVQDYIEGQTLRHIMNTQGRSNVDFASEILKQTLGILDYIHHIPLLHRDIKPENLIWSHDGQIFLIDFGAVKAVVQQQKTDPDRSTVIYTQGYAPPEQIRGQVSPESDLYSLAACVLELLTEKSPQDLYQADKQCFVWESLAPPELSQHMREVLNRMTLERVADRYPTAQAVIQALFPEETLNQTNISSVVFTEFKRGPQPIGTTLTKEPFLKLGKHRPPIQALAWSPNSQMLALGNGGLNIWRIPEGVAVIFSGMESIKVTALDWAGRYLAGACQDGCIKIWQIGEPTPLQMSIPAPAKVQILKWSPDETLLAGVSGEYIFIWDAHNGQELLRLYEGSQVILTAFDWRPGSQFLAVGTNQGYISIWEAMTEQKTTQWQGHRAAIANLQWGSDGQSLLTGAEDGHIYLWEAYTEKQILHIETGHSLNCLSWNSPVQLIATGNPEGSLDIWNQKTGKKIDSMRGIVGNPCFLAWSPDSRCLAMGGNEDTVYLWTDF